MSLVDDTPGARVWQGDGWELRGGHAKLGRARGGDRGLFERRTQVPARPPMSDPAQYELFTQGLATHPEGQPAAYAEALRRVRAGIIEVRRDGGVWLHALIRQRTPRPLVTPRQLGMTVAPGHYPSTALYTGGDILLHRLIWLVFKGPIPDGWTINHKDGNKTNNALDNLECVTQAANNRHAWDSGLCTPTRGERSGMSKLRRPDIQTIRALRADGWTQRAIADHFEVADSTICRILSGQRWGHL